EQTRFKHACDARFAGRTLRTCGPRRTGFALLPQWSLRTYGPRRTGFALFASWSLRSFAAFLAFYCFAEVDEVVVRFADAALGSHRGGAFLFGDAQHRRSRG